MSDISLVDRFLVEVDKRAYRMALVVTRTQPDALDIVQDAMLAWVEHYSHRPESEWRPLFFRILQNTLTSWKRKRAIRQPFQALTDLFHADPSFEPEEQLRHDDRMAQVERSVRALPIGQQRVFMLRNWEGMSVAETAFALEVSEGTVKTQYSRAIQALKEALDVSNEVRAL